MGQIDKENKQTFEFEIAGLPYRLRSSHDEATVQELVRYVESKINESMNAVKSGSFQSAAVLTALNIAEELILLKRRASHELQRLEAKTLELAQEIEKTTDPKK